MVDYQRVFEKVRTKIFQDIYNYSTVTLRNNIRLTPLADGKIVRRVLHNNVVTTDLPDRNRWWRLFMVKNQHLSNLLKKYRNWVDMEHMLNEHKVNVDILTVGQRLIPNRLVYCKSDGCGHTLIAVLAEVYQRYEEPEQTTYMVIHKDTDVPNDRWSVSHIPGEHDNLAPLLTEVMKHDTKHLLLFIDGYEYTRASFLENYREDVYLEMYIDENVQLDFTADLDEREVYYSEHEKLYKDVVVIPRELTDGRAYTYDTVVVVVRDQQGRGVYLPFLADKSVSSLTHTTFSISSFLIDAAFDKLGVDIGQLYIQASSYSKDNELVPNGNLTEEMYRLDDKFIKEAVLGDIYPPISHWTGNRLEGSTYSKYLTDITELQTYDVTKIKRLIECMGYYPFILFTCRHNGELKQLGMSVSTINLPVPLFWEDSDLYPILYLDGHKVNHTRYTVERGGGLVKVEFSDPLLTNSSNSVLQYQWVRHTQRRTYRTVANTDNSTWAIPKHSGQIKIFKKVTGVKIQAVDETLTTGYQELPAHSNDWYSFQEVEDNYVLQFYVGSFSHEFVVTFDDQVVYNVRHNVELSSGNTLTLRPVTKEVMSGDELPVLGDALFEVYLNDRYLTPDVDWCVKRLIDQDDQSITAGYQIVLQNLSYLRDDSTDRFDVYQTSQVVHRRDVGYVVDHLIPRNQANEAWVPGLTRLFINGKLVPYDQVTRHATHYEISPGYANNGNVYCFEFGISKDFQNAFVPHLDSEYFEARIQVNHYLTHEYFPEYQEPVIIPFPHRVYSSYLNEVIKRILAGEVEVHFINNDADIQGQLAAYEYLKEFDLFFRDDGELDLKFSDVYPGYLADREAVSLNHYRYINRLIRIHLGADKVHDGMVVYTGQ